MELRQRKIKNRVVIQILLAVSFLCQCAPITDFGVSTSLSSSPTPTLAWTPQVANFGTITIGNSSAPLTFYLANSGTSDATGCTAPSLTGTNASDFSIQTDNCGTSDIKTGKNCTVILQATPSTTSSTTVTLTQTCSTGGTNTTFANGISVTGTYSSATWSPLTQAFGNVSVGAASTAQTFTLSNPLATAATECLAPSLEGTDSGEFSIINDTCAYNDLPAGGSCTVTVVAQPSTTGAKTATLARACGYVIGAVTTTANGITATGI